MLNTVIYDMDGLLLDTEPLWGESMWAIAEKYQIPITKERFKETTGLRIYEVTDYWAQHLTWNGATPSAVADEIIDDIIARTIAKGGMMPGAKESLAWFECKQFNIALASSSPMRMITALLQHFELTHWFKQVSSADFVGFGKPHPAVFLHCAQALGVQPGNCLVLEDSVNGVIAAKAARMKVIAIPDPAHIQNPRFAIADHIINSLHAVMDGALV